MILSLHVSRQPRKLMIGLSDDVHDDDCNIDFEFIGSLARKLLIVTCIGIITWSNFSL